MNTLIERICDALRAGPLTRPALVAKLSVPRTTIYQSLKRLMANGDVHVDPVCKSGRMPRRGRPMVEFRLINWREAWEK